MSLAQACPSQLFDLLTSHRSEGEWWGRISLVQEFGYGLRVHDDGFSGDMLYCRDSVPHSPSRVGFGHDAAKAER